MFSLKAASFYEPLLGPVLKNLRAEVLSLISIQEPEIFLDCCCGAGGLLKFYFNKNEGAPATSLGLDLSLSMLAEARKNAPTAKLFCADASSLPLADKSVAVASVCMALHAMPLDVAMACVRELCRVSERVIIADYCLAERNLYTLASLTAHAVECMVGGEHYKNYKDFIRLGALEGFLRHMGYGIHTRRTVLGGAGQVVLLS